MKTTEAEWKTVANGKVRELNRDQLLGNLDDLLFMNAMTQAELESAAGVYTGYISRMKSDPRKLPALDVLWKMAQVLEVSLEWIIEGTVRDLDENVLYVRRFLQKLFDRTVAGKLVWKSWPCSRLNGILSGAESCTDLPCVARTPEGAFRPFSLAFPGMENSFADAAFTVQIDEKHILCISKMQFSELIEPENPASLHSHEWLELQSMDLENGETAIVASSSGNGDDRLEAALEKLYHQLMRHMDDLKLAPALRTMIDSFMNQPDEMEKGH